MNDKNKAMEVLKSFADIAADAIEGGLELQCPHCEKTFFAKIAMKAFDQQTVYMQIGFQGDLLQARTIWQTIKGMEDALKATGKDLGGKIEVNVRSIEMQDGTFKVGFLLTDQKAVNRK